MTEPKAPLRVFMDRLAHLLDTAMPEFFGKRMGFVLLISPFGEEGEELHYVSNCDRDDTVTTMLEFVWRQNPERLKQAVDRLAAQQLHGAGAERSN